MVPFLSPKKAAPPSPTALVEYGYEPGHVKWPPKVIGETPLGYVHAQSQHFYSRDIGRSSQFAGRVYYFFGDTFCNNAGVSSNTYQVVPDLGMPAQAVYPAMDPNGFVPPLIDMTSEERAEMQRPENEGKRLAFWSFGGVIEVSAGLGWTWYQKFVIHPGTPDKLVGVGVARISLDKDKVNGTLSAARMPDGLMFYPVEPLFGSFSSLLVGGEVYLWGQIDADVFLARVPKENCQQRHMYQYWDGKEYVSDITQVKSVLQDFQQGQFFESDLFGPRFPWVFVGVTKYGDSKVMLGKAPRVEGPWDVHPIFEAYGIIRPDAFRYCIYPHPWGAKAAEGKLMVSWSEHWHGGVIATKLHLEKDHVRFAALTKAMELLTKSFLQFTELTDPHCLRIEATNFRAVEEGIATIKHHIRLAIKREMNGARWEEAQADLARGRRRPSLSQRIGNMLCGLR
ncbi:MAG: hypothetical protein Q9201_004637 [Fulgogasparrea decipioides]